MDEYFKGKPVETAYVIGKHTGLRISDILKFRVRDCLKKNYSIREQKTGKQKIMLSIMTHLLDRMLIIPTILPLGLIQTRWELSCLRALML